jgi:hypothetical protein
MRCAYDGQDERPHQMGERADGRRTNDRVGLGEACFSLWGQLTTECTESLTLSACIYSQSFQKLT